MSTKLDYLGLVPIERQLRCLGEFYNVPVTAEGEDLAANLKKLRVRRLGFQKFPLPPPTTHPPPKQLSTNRLPPPLVPLFE